MKKTPLDLDVSDFKNFELDAIKKIKELKLQLHGAAEVYQAARIEVIRRGGITESERLRDPNINTTANYKES